MQLIELQILGHEYLLDALNGLDATQDNQVVCGTWSLKDVLGHLTSYERVRNDLLISYVAESPVATPFWDIITERGHLGYNDYESHRRKAENYDDILKEYLEFYKKNIELIPQIPHEKLMSIGTISWFYPQFDVEDFLIYSGLAHKLEHGSQINLLKTKLNL